MNIVVFDVAAESKGALTVLKKYYNEMLSQTEHNFALILSVIDLESKQNVEVRNYRWVKRSWFHRLWFDMAIANKVVKNCKADKVVSLQNTLIPRCRVPQIVYLQNILPLAEYGYGLFEEPILWLYQNIIGWLIRRSIKRAETVIVQAEWIRDTCTRKLQVPASKFLVDSMNNTYRASTQYKKQGMTIFFYPANAMKHKNHQLLIEAVKSIEKDSDLKGKYSVVMTLYGDENRNARSISMQIESFNLPINLVGELVYDDVQKYYDRAVLVFPSTLETVGLPLVEAKAHRTPIIASDLLYAHETLGDYELASYFSINDANEMADEMRKYICV